MTYVFVDWVINTSGLGLGVPDSNYPDACHTVEYLLSNGARGAEYFAQLPEPNFLLSQFMAHLPEFEENLNFFDDPRRLLEELTRLTRRGIYDGYQRARKRLKFIQNPQERRRGVLRILDVQKRLGDFPVTVKPSTSPQALARSRRTSHESKSSNKGRRALPHNEGTSD
jgi:hypothetical protein